jgi:RimJ/RimL family protein N-acetyltransferase
MAIIKTAGVYMLQPSHAEAIQELASDPAIAEMTRVPHPYPENAARQFVTQAIKDREAGTAYAFAIEDQGRLVGLCGLRDVVSGLVPELGFWVGRPHWGHGYATLGARMTLEFGFRHLRLDRVRAAAFESNAASRRVLEKNGFQLQRLARHNDPALKRADERLAEYEISAERWREFLDAPHLADLHPGLRAILAAEIAAGNEVLESSSGWPDADSVFVRLKHPFRAALSSLPSGITHHVLQDPHWWKAEYSSSAPRHILAY